MPKLHVILAEIISRVVNLILPAPYFRLLQWRLSALYKLVPTAVARLDRPLDPILGIELCS
jgi:hypothetical protein